MRDLDLQTLRLFAAVCDQRSIARVAEQESIVGSAISKRLAQLEDTVGTPLLLRKRRGVVPTPAGETLLEHARTMLASVGQIERDMAAYATGTRGHVRMLVTASVMAESLADDVAAFMDAVDLPKADVFGYSMGAAAGLQLAIRHPEKVDQLISLYFTEGCPDAIRIKIYCYIASAGLLWSNWCEYKRHLGVDFGEYSLRQYRYAKEYYRIVQNELNNITK